MAHRMPFRATNEITQQFNSGIVKIYSLEDTAAPGYQPEAKVILKDKLPFEERALGINRLYMSRQNQVEISRIIRVPRRNISSQDAAATSDGKQYRIDAVQNVQGAYPPCLDLTLVALEQKFEVMPE